MPLTLAAMTTADPRDRPDHPPDAADRPAEPVADGVPATPRDAVRSANPRSGAGDGGRADGGGLAEPTGPAGERSPGILGRQFRALTLGIVSVVSVIAFEATAVNTAMPQAAHSLHGVQLYAYAFSAYFTASLFAMALSGEWCDRSGPLVPLFSGIGAFAVGLGLSGSAQQMWTLIAGRAVQGVGGGLTIVALYVVVGRAYPRTLQPAVLASFSAAWVVPAIVGPLLAGAITEHIGWRWVFLAIPLLVLLPLAVMLPALRKVPPGERTASMNRRRVVLALGVAVGAGVLQYAGQDLRWLSLLPAVVGGALLVPCALRLLPRGTFRAARGLPSVVLLRGIAGGSFTAAESFIPLMLVTERGMSVTEAGLSLAGGGLTWALGSYTQSRPSLEAYRERLMGLSMALVAVSIGLSAAVLVDGAPVWIVALAWVLGGYGMGVTISSGSVLMFKLSEPEETGSNSASLQVSDALGNITLVGVSGVLFVAFGGGAVAVGAEAAAGSLSGAHHPGAFAVVMLTMAAVAMVAALVTTRLRPAGR